MNFSHNSCGYYMGLKLNWQDQDFAQPGDSIDFKS